MSTDSAAVNGSPSKKQDPINLSGWSLGTVDNFLSRTADYTKDPGAYLEKFLGSEAFEKRRHLLSIPEVIDKDVYGNGAHKFHFQQHIADLFGKESALFFITGVQAQLAALKVYCRKADNNRVAWHVTSHLEEAEERAFEELYGLDRVLLGNRKDENPTVEEIKEVLSLPKDQRPAVILLELPNRNLGCKTYTFKELESISSACQAADVMLHCDGARIWEIEPYYQKTAGKTFAEIGSLFDSIYVSFYKGLRGISGAMLVGSEDLIRESKVWQRRAGGNVISLLYEVIDCERGFNENIGSFGQKRDKMVEVQDRILSSTQKFKAENGQAMVEFVAVPPTCCQVITTFNGYTVDELMAARDKVAAEMNVIIFRHVRAKKTLDEMNKAERTGTATTQELRAEQGAVSRQYNYEWLIGNETQVVDSQVFADAYVALCRELVAAGTGSKA